MPKISLESIFPAIKVILLKSTALEEFAICFGRIAICKTECKRTSILALCVLESALQVLQPFAHSAWSANWLHHVSVAHVGLG